MYMLQYTDCCANNTHSPSKSALSRQKTLFVSDIGYNFQYLQRRADMNALWISVTKSATADHLSGKAEMFGAPFIFLLISSS